MRINKLLCACLAALLLIACGASALAKVPSPSKEFYYLDQANVLSEATEGEIFFSNQLLEDACGAQIVVVTVKSTGSESLSDYAYEMINQWGIGDKDVQNGFLLVLAIDDDDYYAVPGTGLQPKFTSGAIKDYYDKYLETDFAAKRYDAGVKKFFEAVFARIADTYNADVTIQDGINTYQTWAASADPGPMSAISGGAQVQGGSGYEEESDFMGMLLMAMIVIVLIVILTRTSRRRRVARQVFVAPPPPPPTVGQGGYRGVNNMPGAGGYRGPVQTPRQRSDNDWLTRGLLYGLFRSSGGGSSFRSSGSTRSSSSFRSSSSGSRSFGSARGGGGGSRGGGAGRGRH